MSFFQAIALEALAEIHAPLGSRFDEICLNGNFSPQWLIGDSGQIELGLVAISAHLGEILIILDAANNMILTRIWT